MEALGPMQKIPETAEPVDEALIVHSIKSTGKVNVMIPQGSKKVAGVSKLQSSADHRNYK